MRTNIYLSLSTRGRQVVELDALYVRLRTVVPKTTFHLISTVRLDALLGVRRFRECDL